MFMKTGVYWFGGGINLSIKSKVHHMLFYFENEYMYVNASPLYLS